MSEPSLLIVEAPMGEGKTEAGWYAATCWNRRGGQGAYVALPTMATSNQMFERVGEFLEADPGKKNLMLQHGKAALNKKFDDLKYAAKIYDPDGNTSGVVAEGWFAANKKHGLLAPFGVGTIDQALLCVLQTKHFFVRLFGLAGKCVILDEVHAYDAYMTTLMELLLRWLAALRCPVILLSATLPREKRLQLLRAYTGAETPEPDWKDYPRITSVAITECAVNIAPVKADPTRERTVRRGWLSQYSLVDKLQESLANGGCVAVIRNTVRTAQESYQELKNHLQNEIDSGELQLDLFHAQFPFGRRKQIEDEVLEWYGRTKDDVVKEGRIMTAPHRPRKAILVATQVVEQSLDLDFDVMVSDIAPVDLVLQRAGRLWRHHRDRPHGMEGPQLWLIEPVTKDQLPDFGHSKWVYARFVLMRSLLALKAFEVVQLPQDLERLVEQVYGSEPLAVPADWEAALEVAKQEYQDKRDNQQLNATDVAINAPDQAPLEQQSQQLEEDDPGAAKKIQAQTRDADPSIQLIVIYHIHGHDYLDPGGLEPFQEVNEPDTNQVRRLLDNEVTVSHRPCFAWYAAQPVPKAWRKKGMLRYHRIARVDGAGDSLSGDFFLRVDPELGIRFANC
jgi:CRISPR-associated endonuclease/helicase Cas3